MVLYINERSEDRFCLQCTCNILVWGSDRKHKTRFYVFNVKSTFMIRKKSCLVCTLSKNYGFTHLTKELQIDFVCYSVYTYITLYYRYQFRVCDKDIRYKIYIQTSVCTHTSHCIIDISFVCVMKILDIKFIYRDIIVCTHTSHCIIESVSCVG